MKERTLSELFNRQYYNLVPISSINPITKQNLSSKSKAAQQQIQYSGPFLKKYQSLHQQIMIKNKTRERRFTKEKKKGEHCHGEIASKLLSRQ